MGFKLGTSNNSGKLQMSGFLSDSTGSTNVETDIPIEQLVPWENQPFKMYSEFKLHELAESIKENGLLSRIIVYPIGGGKYRIIAGHNRVEACRLAGIENIPSIVKNGIDENRAKLIMADTNLCQRMELLPSERAYAYKAQQEALIALGSPRSTAAIAEKYGEGRRTIQRYISCSRLTPKLMDMLDSGRITLDTAVVFSGMPESDQKETATYLKDNLDQKIDPECAKRISEKKFITQSDIEAAVKQVSGTRKEKPKSPKAESVSSVGQEKDSSFRDESDEDEADQPLQDNDDTAQPNDVSEIPEKENIPIDKPDTSITLNYKEVAEIIGDELSADEISEYLFFCLQRSDFLDEWKALFKFDEDEDDNSL